MKKTSTLLILISLFAITSAQIKQERQWPSYRGFMSSGVLDNAVLPETFDFKTGQGIRWKIEIPGMGLSSPVLWGDNLFITSAVSQTDKTGLKTGMYGDVAPVNDTSVHEWKVYCIDKKTGKIRWEKTAYKGVPRIKRHPKSTHANSTMATDGNFAVAFFGSEGLYCYDMKGNLAWKKDFGVLKSVFFAMKNAEWEFASSPIIYKGVVIVQCDVLENSFIAAYDVKTGRELWKTIRDEYPGWCTPNIYMYNGLPAVALNGYKLRAGYDFQTGKEIWRMSGGGDIQIPTPILGKDIIYFNSAHGSSSPILAVKTSANGDITLKGKETANDHILWSIPRGGSYMHTMLLYKDHLYNVGWNGMVNCLNAHTGAEIWSHKLGNTETFVASPVAADGKIYIVSETGTVFIIKDGPAFEQVAEIPMGDASLVAPAISEGMIFFRSQKYLIGVGK